MKLMMKHQEAKKLIPTEFKRLCGVYPETFELMVKIVKVAQKQKKVLGRPSSHDSRAYLQSLDVV